MLTFIKRTATSWQHDNGTVKSSFGGGIPITNDTENTIVFQLPNGTNFPIKSVLITDCKIIDKTDGDAEYTFATTTDFLDKLEELNYPFINTGGGGGAGTNLGYTPSASNGIVTSSTGTDATIPLANGTNAGLSENNVTDSEKSFLLTAGGLSLDDYAKTDAVITAIGEALTTAETYTDNALEDYSTTVQMNMALALKQAKASVIAFHTAQTLADGGTYFFGTIPTTPATVTSGSRRLDCPLSGKIKRIVAHTFSASPTSAQDVVLKLNNKTTSTANTVGNIRYDNTSYMYEFTVDISVTKYDSLELELNVPTLTTNGTNSVTSVQIFFEENT